MMKRRSEKAKHTESGIAFGQSIAVEIPTTADAPPMRVTRSASPERTLEEAREEFKLCCALDDALF